MPYVLVSTFNLNLCENIFSPETTFVEKLGWGETIPLADCGLKRSPGVPLLSQECDCHMTKH